MDRSTKDAWLSGPGDLKEDIVEDVPVKGQSVKVRGLPAAYSNQASSEALEMKTIGDAQIATVNTARLEVLQFAHGCVDPEFSEAEAQAISERFGPAFKKVIAAIDKLSGVDKEAFEKAEARFQGSGEQPPRGKGETQARKQAGAAPATGSDGPPIRARVSA